MMGAPRLLTVVLNWRTPEMTMRAVQAALREMQGNAGEVTVVDNDSQDGSFEHMTAHVAAQGWADGANPVRVIQSGHNGGFGAGNNVGIRAGFRDGSRPDYVYVLNSDAFPGPGAIRRLLETLEQDHGAGFAGSYIHGEDGAPHLTTFRFPSIASEFEGAIRFGPVSRMLAHRAVPVPIPAQNRDVDWLAGASLMMRQSVLDQIGMFDERFFLYFEETDLCQRARRAGHRIIYVRDSMVAHVGSVSTGMKEWRRVPGYWFDSRLHYFVKNHGVVYAAIASFAHVTGGLLHRIRALLTGRRPADPPHFLRSLLQHDLAAMFQPRKAPEPAPVTRELTGVSR